MHRVSSLALREEWSETDDEHQYHIVGGYARLLGHLEKRIMKSGGSIVVSSAVDEVQWSNGKLCRQAPGR